MDIRLFLEWKPPWIGGRQLILKKAPNGTAWTIALAHALRRPAQDRREQRVHLRDIESLMMEFIKHRRQPEDHLPVDIFAPNFHQKSPNDSPALRLLVWRTLTFLFASSSTEVARPA